MEYTAIFEKMSNGWYFAKREQYEIENTFCNEVCKQLGVTKIKQ